MIEVTIRSAEVERFRGVIERVAASIDPDHPPLIGVLCTGSVPQGTSTASSDLDICVCCDAPISRFTRFRIEGTAVDLVYEDARWLHDAGTPYDPTGLFWLAHAKVLWERGKLLSRHVARATEQFDGPAPEMTEWERFLLKIDCSERLSRLVGAPADDVNVPFLTGGLLEKSVEAALKLSRRWYLDTGHGLRDLRTACPDLADRLARAAAEGDGPRKCEMLKTFLSELFGEELPLDGWDSDWVTHGR